MWRVRTSVVECGEYGRVLWSVESTDECCGVYRILYYCCFCCCFLHLFCTAYCALDFATDNAHYYYFYSGQTQKHKLRIFPGMRTHTYIHTFINTHRPLSLSLYIYVCMRTCTHTHMQAHTHTLIHAYTHTHTHTQYVYIHTPTVQLIAGIIKL